MTSAPRYLALLIAMAACFCLCATALHGNPTTETGPGTVAAAIATIVANHAESPAPQQLALTAARSFLRHTRSPARLDLAEQAGKLNSPQEILDFLKRLDRERPDGLQAVPVWTGVLEELVGSCDGLLIPKRDAAVNETISSNRYVGTGIVLNHQDDYPTMAKVIAGGPAARAGARDGDRIVSVDGQDTKDWDLRTAIDALRGPQGSEVKVKLLAPEAAPSGVREYTITRDVVPFESVESLQVLTGSGRGFGYARITSIRSSTVHELRKIERAAVEAKLQGLILDLRHINNGRVHDTVLLANAFLEAESPIGRSRSAEGIRDYTAENGILFEDLPVAILIDPTTSGPGEWLAGAIARNEAAILVGLPTGGKPVAMDSFEIAGSDWVIDLPHTLLEGPNGAPLFQRGKTKPSEPDRVSPHEIVRPPQPQKGPSSEKKVFPGVPDREVINERELLEKAIEALRKKLGN